MESDEIASLKASVDSLKDELKDTESKLQQAAEIGKRLLEDNSQHENQMQDMVKEHQEELESLKQNNYSLKLKLEQKCHMEAVYSEEIENLKLSLQKLKETLSMKGEAEYQAEVSNLKSQVCQQQSELDLLNLNEKQYKERNCELEKLLDETRDQLQQKVNLLNDTSSEEISQLHSEMNSLQGEKLKLMRELGYEKDHTQQLQLQLGSVQEQLHIKAGELEERQCQVTSYYNALEKSREEILELKAEIDMIKMETQDQKSKGNSLFSEVEDRRIRAEKELITLKVEYSSLKKQYEASRQSHCRLKMQLAGLLHNATCNADAELVESLQQQLSQKNSEILNLLNKLNNYEKQEKNFAEHVVDFQKGKGETVDKNYLEFLKALNDSKQKEFDKLEGELSTKNLQLLAEGQRLVSCQSQLYKTEKMLQSFKSENYKLQVQVEELQLKYEPDKLKTSQKVRKVVKEQIPLTQADLELMKKQENIAVAKNIETKKVSEETDPKKLELKLKREILKQQLIQSSRKTVGQQQKQPVQVLLLNKTNELNTKNRDDAGTRKRVVTICDKKVEFNTSEYDSEMSVKEGVDSLEESCERFTENDEEKEQELKRKMVERQKNTKKSTRKVVKVTNEDSGANECKNQ